ncbi:hypothetical protein WME75_06720 [Sorangium sp. So ce1014]|uniref:hypothetical protein n=1 Tax=Sorangium sp. So ce1014 TaxID=3133326 RepID=UPI003F61739A
MRHKRPQYDEIAMDFCHALRGRRPQRRRSARLGYGTNVAFSQESWRRFLPEADDAELAAIEQGRNGILERARRQRTGGLAERTRHRELDRPS